MSDTTKSGARPRMFQDRRAAGRLLGEALAANYSGPDVIVLGLPRGGVPVADEVARRLGAPLDVIVVRKLGLRPDARAFLDGTRRFAQQITPDPGGSALTSGLGGRPSRLDGSTQLT